MSILNKKDNRAQRLPGVVHAPGSNEDYNDDMGPLLWLEKWKTEVGAVYGSDGKREPMNE